MNKREEYLPHEQTLDVLVAEELVYISNTYGTNAHVIAHNLEVILKDFGLACIARATGEDVCLDDDITCLIEETEVFTEGASTAIALTEEGEI